MSAAKTHTPRATLFKMEVKAWTRAEADLPHTDDGVAVGYVVDGGGFGSIALVMLAGDQVLTAVLSPDHFHSISASLLEAHDRIMASASSQPVTVQ